MRRSKVSYLLSLIRSLHSSVLTLIADTGLAKTLLASRTAIQTPLARLDGVTGINFESNFSFAVACHLLKGLRHPSTKTSTARLLTTFLGITAKRGVGSEVLGYLTALLPTEGVPANMDQLYVTPPLTPNPTPPLSLLLSFHYVPSHL